MQREAEEEEEVDQGEEEAEVEEESVAVSNPLWNLLRVKEEEVEALVH